MIGGFSGFYRLVEFYRGQKPSGLKGNIQFSVNSYRVRPYPTTKGGFNIDRRFLSGFYRLVECDRGRKPSGRKGNIQFSGNLYRVCPYPTNKGGFNSFLMFFT